MLRALRILLASFVLPVLFSFSQQMARARGNEPVPGLAAALGVLSALFLVRAAATEWSRGPDFDVQKDVLWGIGAGGLFCIGLLFAGAV